MVKINKEEAMAIRKAFPNAHIAITNKQSGHKKYYLEEAGYLMRFLTHLRNSRVIYSGFEGVKRHG